MDSTTYYNTNASKFIDETVNADMSAIRDPFLLYIPSGGRILDAGCGPGRDVKAFKDSGYDVYVMDASDTMLNYCAESTGYSVRTGLDLSNGNARLALCSFQDYTTELKFDGIWACASLLHLKSVTTGRDLSLQAVIKKFTGVLKPGGVFFMSFKYGTENYVKDGRYFNCHTEESVRELVRTCLDLSEDTHLNLSIIDLFITNDVRHGRADEKWVNVIVRKS